VDLQSVIRNLQYLNAARQRRGRSRRHDERLAVLTAQHLIRLLVSDEPLGLRVELELAADVILQSVDRHRVLFQVLLDPDKRLVGLLVVAKALLAELNGSSVPSR